jgi:hypothetical protein
MQSAKEYRELMEEALRWAKTARSKEERNTFLQIAKAWYDAAILAEGGIAAKKGVIEQE